MALSAEQAEVGRETKQTRVSSTSSRLDALKRLRVPKRPRAQSYRTTIEGLSAERDAVAWYWRLLAVGSMFLILGGCVCSNIRIQVVAKCPYRFLMLPATFENDRKLRVSKQLVGIFAIAILTAGFCFTGLLTFAVRNAFFQADAIFLPSLSSCAVGLLTLFYDFLISSRYEWSTPALLTSIAAALSTLVYAGLLFYTNRKITLVRSRGRPSSPLRPVEETISRGDSVSRWQDTSYYDNYIQNMFPTSAHPPPHIPGYDPNSITEEEMQRQQMLMLLLHRDQAPTPNASQSTFRIDWQGQEQDDSSPPYGYYAPPPDSAASMSSSYPLTGISRQWTNQELQPWDGVWRSPVPAVAPGAGRGRPHLEQWNSRERSQERREERRREIEMGR